MPDPEIVKVELAYMKEAASAMAKDVQQIKDGLQETRADVADLRKDVKGLSEEITNVREALKNLRDLLIKFLLILFVLFFISIFGTKLLVSILPYLTNLSL